MMAIEFRAMHQFLSLCSDLCALASLREKFFLLPNAHYMAEW